MAKTEKVKKQEITETGTAYIGDYSADYVYYRSGDSCTGEYSGACRRGTGCQQTAG